MGYQNGGLAYHDEERLILVVPTADQVVRVERDETRGKFNSDCGYRVQSRCLVHRDLTVALPEQPRPKRTVLK